MPMVDDWVGNPRANGLNPKLGLNFYVTIYLGHCVLWSFVFQALIRSKPCEITRLSLVTHLHVLKDWAGCFNIILHIRESKSIHKDVHIGALVLHMTHCLDVTNIYSFYPWRCKSLNMRKLNDRHTDVQT